MTHDILQSDLDVARRLMKAASADADIVATLKLRGVAEAKANQLVRDLRGGRLVTPATPMSPVNASGHMQDELLGEPPPARRPREDTARQQNERAGNTSSRGRANSAKGTWTVALLLFGLAVGGSFVLWWVWSHSYHAKTRALLARSQSEAMNNLALQGQGGLSKGAPLPSSGVVFELRSDGLHVASALVTTGNALRAMSSAFGPPTRTNWIEQGKVVYAYDRHGVLLYSGGDKSGDSVVLDYEGAGGTNGTSLPFAGNLKVEDYSLQPNTSSSALAAIQPLGLSKPSDDSGTYRGRYNNLDLFFAYLNGPSRLSLVEINLKSQSEPGNDQH